MKAQDLMAKAIQAAVSAKVLLGTGDTDGACNRACYAMFDAARAAPLAAEAPVEPEIAKTHSGLISAFSLHLVKTGRVPVELGKTLNKAEELRLVADYESDPIEREDAAWAVSQAQAFVQAMQAMFMPNAPGSNPNDDRGFSRWTRREYEGFRYFWLERLMSGGSGESRSCHTLFHRPVGPNSFGHSTPSCE